MKPSLVLASHSPRRRDLLAAAGLDFEVLAPAVAESASRALSIAELTTFNAGRKATAVARVRADAVILAADTLVALDGEIIGKPRDMEDARRILRRLSGREHQVCTGVRVCSGAVAPARSFCVISHVQFRELSDEQIRAYLATIDPLDKAGAYAAQGHGAEIIQRIRGSYTNVVGLPMEETLAALRELGVVPAPTTC